MTLDTTIRLSLRARIAPAIITAIMECEEVDASDWDVDGIASDVYRDVLDEVDCLSDSIMTQLEIILGGG